MSSTHYKLTKDELFKVSKIEELVKKVRKNHSPEFSDFLSPNLWPHLKSLLKISDLVVERYQINEHGEYSIVMIYPDYMTQDDLEIPVSALQIEILGNDEISHRDCLGAVMNLGIKREKIGDIFIDEDSIYLIVIEDMKAFVMDHLTMIKHSNIRITEVNHDRVKSFSPRFKEVNINVSSMRLDLLISKVFHLSRGESQNLFSQGKIKHNHGVAISYKKEAKIGDLISVRGKGRFSCVENLGTSKKGNVHLLIHVYK